MQKPWREAHPIVHGGHFWATKVGVHVGKTFAFLYVLQNLTSFEGEEDNNPLIWVSLMAQMVKNPPARQETRIRSLGQEDPLEKKISTHSSILA